MMKRVPLNIFSQKTTWKSNSHSFAKPCYSFQRFSTSTEALLEEPVAKNKALLPKEILRELNRKIIGQEEAKKAVANALRNRWRRKQISEAMKNEIVPKNILMVGPTGVGKTEIARRLAKLTNAPFIKVEATKFTEVGFHGRDVDQIIRDLVEIAINDTKAAMVKKNAAQYQRNAEEKVVETLFGELEGEAKEQFVDMLRKGEMDGRTLEVSVNNPVKDDLQSIVRLFNNPQKKSESRKTTMTVKEALAHFSKQESEKLNMDEIIKLSITAVEEEGIVFIDEIDKICISSEVTKKNADASSEGVQRDLLPIIEGSVINTKHGNIDTSKILFIASGAFYSCKPADLLPELQGRLPIRVELKALTENDFYRILTEPEMNLLQQQVELMKTENIDLKFTDEAVHEMAHLAADVNRTVENIGARRLHTIIEKIVEDVSYNCDLYSGTVVITPETVKERLTPLLKKTDLSKFVL